MAGSDETYDPKDEINRMNEGERFAATDPPGTQAPGTEAPGTEAPGTEAPGTEAPGTEAPSTEAPTTEIPPEPTEEELLQKQREELERTLAEKGIHLTRAPSTTAPSTRHPSTEAPFDPEAEVDFVGDQALDDTLGDKASLNALLNRVYKAGVGAGARMGTEKVLRSIPEIVQKNITAQSSIIKAREEFYKNNEDLKPFPRVVAETFQSIASENPEWKMEQLLNETEKLSRQRLNLHRKVMVPSANPKDKPKFEKTPKGKKGAPKAKLEGLAKELDDMQKSTD
jgi:hypothetical protein